MWCFCSVVFVTFFSKYARSTLYNCDKNLIINNGVVFFEYVVMYVILFCVKKNLYDF